MLNLLRFKEVASYAPNTHYADISGSEAFAIYARLMMPLVDEVGGEVVWVGKAASLLVAPSGEHWDEVVLVRYPDKDAFVNMTTTGRYVEISVHRTAALADSRLIALVEGQVQQAANHPSFAVTEHD